MVLPVLPVHDSYPPASNLLLNVRNACVGLRLRSQPLTDGTLQFRNQAQSQIDVSSTVLALNVWHRLEFHFTTTRWEGRIFAGPTLSGPPRRRRMGVRRDRLRHDGQQPATGHRHLRHLDHLGR